jgi:ribosomal protein L12E/L44/L45/RPP1/RPP2
MDRRRDYWEQHGLLRIPKEEAAKEEETKEEEEEEEEAGGGCRFRQK